MSYEIKGFYREYFPLSNFYDNGIMQVSINGIGFTSVEAAFQAEKSVLVMNSETNLRKYNHLLKAFSKMTPDEAKVIGRNIILRDDWYLARDAIMLNLVYQKFHLNPVLKELLLGTKDAYLEETNNWHDNYWGNCICEKCKNIPGKNVLGIILTKVRDTLRKE